MVLIFSRFQIGVTILFKTSMLVAAMQGVQHVPTDRQWKAITKTIMEHDHRI